MKRGKGWFGQRRQHSVASRKGWRNRKNPKKRRFRIFELKREYDVPHRKVTTRRFGAFKNDKDAVGKLKYSSDVYLEDTGPVGYKHLNKEAGKDFGGIAHVVTFQGERNKGVGTGLVKKGIETARKEGKKGVILEVRKDNYKARALYEKMGFKYVNLPSERGLNVHGKRAYYVLMIKRFEGKE